MVSGGAVPFGNDELQGDDAYAGEGEYVEPRTLDLDLYPFAPKRKRMPCCCNAKVPHSGCADTSSDVNHLELQVNAKRLHQVVFKDNICTAGGKVKRAGSVLKTRASNSRRQPNVNCRVDAIGKICGGFDDKQKKWVVELGFGGLLHLVGMRLPRTLCYWLMTRVDPMNEMFNACDGHKYRIVPNHVRWVLGLPNGVNRVPRRAVDEKMKHAVTSIENQYGKEWTIKRKSTGRVIKNKGIPITSTMISRLEAPWEDHEEYEFKTLFLLVSLHLVLCPTQGPRLGADLIPAVTCVRECNTYNWCELVIDKFMCSVRSFAKRFYSDGFAGGCGGCSIFLAVFYLDKLDRNPLMWGVFPRIKVWTNEAMRKASNEDRDVNNGDFGLLGCLDIAYGEPHPRNARDAEAPEMPIDYEVYRTSQRNG